MDTMVDMSRLSGEEGEIPCILRGGIRCLCRKCSSSSREARNGDTRSERSSEISGGEKEENERGTLLTFTRRQDARTAIYQFFFGERTTKARPIEDEDSGTKYPHLF